MPGLREIQQSFVSDLFSEGAERVGKHIVDSAFPGEALLQVYRNNSFHSLTDALGDVYPVVQKLVGEGFFAYAADGYIRQYPSRSGNLHDFGYHYGQFIAGFEPAATLPYLADVARLEWAYQEVFHAADHGPLAPETLASIPPDLYPALRFRLHPASRLVQSDYPIFEIWRVNQDGCKGEVQVNLAQGGQSVLLVRPKIDVQLQCLSRAEHAFLQALANGETLNAAVDGALAVEPEFELNSVLPRHIGQGTLVEVIAPSETESTDDGS